MIFEENHCLKWLFVVTYICKTIQNMCCSRGLQFHEIKLLITKFNFGQASATGSLTDFVFGAVLPPVNHVAHDACSRITITSEVKRRKQNYCVWKWNRHIKEEINSKVESDYINQNSLSYTTSILYSHFIR